jgi:probable HAF family extracellular repeat protein
MNSNIQLWLALSGLLTVPAVADAQQYLLQEIPTIQGFSGQLLGTAINAQGVVTGSAYSEPYNINPHVFVYSKGVTTDLGDANPIDACDTPDSGATAAGINTSGQIAATICATTEFPSAALLADGVYTSFAGTGMYNVPPVAWSSAINSGGLVTGTLELGGGPCAGNLYHAFIYNSGTATLQDLGTLGYCSAQSFAINDAGQIVGTASGSSGGPYAFIYSNGAVTDLGSLGGQQSYAYAINASGQVTGTSLPCCGYGPDAFLYTGGTMHDIGNLGGLGGSTGYGINTYGAIVGASWTTGNAAQHAFLYSNDTIVDLNALISSADAKRYTLVTGVAINDNGQIVVQGVVNKDVTQTPHSFLLTPLAPSVTPLVIGTVGTNGWYVSDATLSWYVTGTPTPTKSGCDKVKVPNTTGTTYTCSATNSVGSAQQSITIMVDTVAPKVMIRSPINGATYALNRVMLASYTCTDALSGVATCAGSVADGTPFQTSVAGPQTFTVTSTDNAGNTQSKSVSYTVK